MQIEDPAVYGRLNPNQTAMPVIKGAVPIAPAQINRHNPVCHGSMVSERLGPRDVFVGHPDMPRPQHFPRMVFHGNDRITLPDFRTADIKCNISVFSASTIADVSQQVGASCQTSSAFTAVQPSLLLMYGSVIGFPRWLMKVFRTW